MLYMLKYYQKNGQNGRSYLGKVTIYVLSLYIYIYIWNLFVPIYGLQPCKRRPFPIKTSVTRVPGIFVKPSDWWKMFAVSFFQPFTCQKKDSRRKLPFQGCNQSLRGVCKHFVKWQHMTCFSFQPLHEPLISSQTHGDSRNPRNRKNKNKTHL